MDGAPGQNSAVEDNRSSICSVTSVMSYLTVVVVGSFIPWELYSMLDEVTPLKLMTLCINAVIVGYLLMSELRARSVKKNDRLTTSGPRECQHIT